MHHGRLWRIVVGHWRHGWRICSVAPSGQAPKPRSGAPQARGLTARARTELSWLLPRCAHLLLGVVFCQFAVVSSNDVSGRARLARRLLCASR